MFVQTEITPNPNSLKFLPGKKVSNSGPYEITNKDQINNDLVRNILSVNGVEGIFLGQDTLERLQVASTCGLVLGLGPHCYDKDRYPEGPWCKKGEWVIFARYAGSRLKIEGGEIRILNEASYRFFPFEYLSYFSR